MTSGSAENGPRPRPPMRWGSGPASGGPASTAPASGVTDPTTPAPPSAIEAGGGGTTTGASVPFLHPANIRRRKATSNRMGGAVAGGLGGKAAAEAVNPTIEDVGATSAASDAPDRSANGSGEPE